MASGYHPDGTFARAVYNKEQIEDALTRYAFCGNYRQVERETGIASQTIAAWRKNSHKERFEEIAEVVNLERADRLQGLTTAKMDLLDKSHTALNAAYDAKDTGAVKDLAAADRNLMVSAATGQDKSRIIQDKPTEISRQHVSSAELASELARLNPQLAAALGILVDSDAEEIDEAEQLPPGTV